jgi:2-polyprenyl-3-methyl-5-hydroxy-6-metoxy-1,4-benzoquinol methylase
VNNKKAWDERYSRPDYYYGREPNDFLVVHKGLFRPKVQVLCLGEGEGRNSVYLAKLGCEVTAVDLSSVALEKLQNLAKENSVNINSVCADLAEFDLGHERWDVIVSIWCHLPSVVRQPLHQRLVASLKPGGHFILESYTPNQIAKATGGPKDVDMLLTTSLITQELAGLEILKADEFDRDVREGIGHNGMSSVVQVFARK